MRLVDTARRRGLECPVRPTLGGLRLPKEQEPPPTLERARAAAEDALRPPQGAGPPPASGARPGRCRGCARPPCPTTPRSPCDRASGRPCQGGARQRTPGVWSSRSASRGRTHGPPPELRDPCPYPERDR